MVTKYRKKPVTIEALKWLGNNEAEMNAFVPSHQHRYEPDGLYIMTLEGDHKANIGDFIVKGVKGEFYPVKSDIFAMTYEVVEEGADE